MTRSLSSSSEPATDRKARGAFFTPPEIADFLCAWAIRDKSDARVLDPTCGEAVFLQAAADRLIGQGRVAAELASQLVGFDVHAESLLRASTLLRQEDAGATLRQVDFFSVVSPGIVGAEFGPFDAVVGNPPFVRYQDHRGAQRSRAVAAALLQGVRLSGLASSWAAALVHAASFLKPDGRLAMVLPAELLTVSYAEPVRRWLSQRFGRVTLVMMERLQFGDAQEKVLLLLAQGMGGCDTFGLAYVDDSGALRTLEIGEDTSVIPIGGKWTELFLPTGTRRLYSDVCEHSFSRLADYGTVGLGTVTGANGFFTLSEAERLQWRIREADVLPICPPGGRHVRGVRFSERDWGDLRDGGESVWLLCPREAMPHAAVEEYIKHAAALGVNEGYKCRIRSPWWRVPTAAPPDLLFTYMSHQFPRMADNAARVRILNSLHGVWFGADVPRSARTQLPLLALNSVTLLGAELNGRSYGGGVLKLEPREAASLPVPRAEDLAAASARLSKCRGRLLGSLRSGRWTNVLKAVDEALLGETLGIDGPQIQALQDAAVLLRTRRLGG